MNRRGFFSGILAVAAAPAIVRPEALMPVRPIPWRFAAGEVLPSFMVVALEGADDIRFGAPVEVTKRGGGFLVDTLGPGRATIMLGSRARWGLFQPMHVMVGQADYGLWVEAGIGEIRLLDFET